MAKKAQRYWFKAKKYGWGWTPSTWEGWTVTLAFVLFLIDYSIHADRSTLFVPFVVSLAILILICYFTGEPPRWQWGEKKRKIR